MLIKRVRAGTEIAIGDEKCGFRQGRGCMDPVADVPILGAVMLELF